MEYAYLILALLAGTATHIIKKVVEVRKTEEDYQIKDWLTKYPYRTVLTVMAGAGGFLGLMAVGELTYASSFMAGYMANSLGGVAK
jgi:hypothetical protein